MNPFEKGNRYQTTGEKVNKFFSEQKYYQEAMLLELFYLENIISIQFYDKSGVILYCNQLSSMNFNNVLKIREYVKDEELFSNEIMPMIISNEKESNHDIVAVQKTLMDIVRKYNLINNGTPLENLVHWGLTSQDIVNTVYTKMVFDYMKNCFDNSFDLFLKSFESFFKSSEYMMGKTHGQNAVPMFNKHIFAVYHDRFFKITESIHSVDVKVKFGNGAIGNNYTQNMFGFDFNDINRRTIQGYFGMRNQFILDERTFQNNYYPYILDIFYNIHKLCTVLKDLSVDMWMYSSMKYINKPFSPDEHGSSTMPQKSNPIEFENAEGNIEMAIGMLEVFMRKLNVSRLQRDLSDLTMMRNVGMIFCYLEKSLESLSKGFDKFQWNQQNISKEVAGEYGNYVKEYVQLREKLLPDGMDYKAVKAMSVDDIKLYMDKNYKPHNL